MRSGGNGSGAGRTGVGGQRRPATKLDPFKDYILVRLWAADEHQAVSAS
jgi:hypothetical protein